MTVIATALAALIEAGVTGEALVAAIGRIEAAQIASQQPVKTARQERNARYYQNRKAKETETEASETVLIKTVKTNSDEQKEGPQTPKKNTTPQNSTAGEPKRTKRQKPEGILCPDDFRPTERHYAKCDAEAVPHSVADATCQKMHRWSHEHADRDIAWKANWSLALHNFLDTEIEKFKRGQSGARASPSGKPSSNGALSRAADLLGMPHEQRPASSASRDFSPVIDHESDGRSGRQIYEPTGGQAGRLPQEAHLRLVSAYGR
jgi:hypothetical protein